MASKTSKPTVESSPARYNRAVAKGRTAIASQGKFNWVIGDLALTVASVYGDGTVKQFADDLDVAPGTVYDFRKVAEKYAPADRGVASWTVHQILAGQDDRAELVKQAMTTTAARELVNSRKGGDVPGEGDGDGEGDGEGNETPDDLATQLAKAKAEVQRIEGQLESARAKVVKLTAEMDQQIAAAKAAKAKRQPRGAGKLASVA